MAASIAFASDGEPSVINYNVALPGVHSGRRLVRLLTDLADDDWTERAFTSGADPAEAAGIVVDAQGDAVVDQARATRYLGARWSAIGHSKRAVAVASQYLQSALTAKSVGAGPGTPPAVDAMVLDRVDLRAVERMVLDVDAFVASVASGDVVIPVPDTHGGSESETVAQILEPDPQLFIIEKYAISSMLGDYGMGRTVRTFTLLPGETTTIKVKTWRSTEASRKESSSIVDSHEDSAKENFENKVQSESTDKSTRASEEKWAVEAKAKATWGWGSASVEASASGSYQSSREEFVKDVSSSVSEEARERSSKRELSVTSESEVTETSGEESTIERTIANVNVRRVLNFVFRELNQEYTTRLHLTDVRVGFTNGRGDSWREVPIAGLHGLLQEVIADEQKQAEVAQAILKSASVVFDIESAPVRVIEMVDYDPLTDTVVISDVEPDPATGLLAPPTAARYYRFKPGSIDGRGVDGVLLSEQDIVMRTDSVIVEALLGQADALDAFAMEIQEAAAAATSLANARERLIQQSLADVSDPVERLQLAVALTHPTAEPDA